MWIGLCGFWENKPRSPWRCRQLTGVGEQRQLLAEALAEGTVAEQVYSLFPVSHRTIPLSCNWSQEQEGLW